MKAYLVALLLALGVCGASVAQGRSSSSILQEPSNTSTSTSGALKPYHLIRSIPLPFLKKMQGRIGFDQDSGRLFFSDGKDLLVINANNGQRVGLIPKIGEASDIALAPDIHRAFIVDANSRDLFVLDLSTLAVVQKTNAGAESSSAQYDPEVKEVFTTGSESSTCKVFDAVTGKQVAVVKLHGYPVRAAGDSHGHIYFELAPNLWRPPPLYAPLTSIAPLKTTLAELNTRTLEIGDSWNETSCPRLQLMGIDRSGQDLVLSCQNSVALVDPQTRKIMALSAITGAVLTFGAQAGDAFVEGVDHQTHRSEFQIVHEDSFGHLGPAVPAPQVWAPPDAFDGPAKQFFAVESDTKTVDTGSFMRTPDGQMIPLTLPQPIPGTFRILVYGRN